jgi:predicted alpha/beta hydrolase
MSDLLPAPAAAPESLRVATGDGHEADLLLVPGNTANIGVLWLAAMGVPARKYRHFAAALAAGDCTVALHEWRGHDSSNRRAARDADWGYAELLEDIAASRAALEAKFPDRRWVIGGHSLGGQLAALALARRPGDFAGYLVAGSGQPWWRTFPGWHKGAILLAVLWFRAASMMCGYFPGDRLGFAGREARGVMRDWADSALSGDYRPARVDFTAEAALRGIALPALAVRMRSDWYVPKASLDHLLHKLPRAQVQRSEIGDDEFSGGRAGHFEWMREPAPLVARIAAWLKSLAA